MSTLWRSLISGGAAGLTFLADYLGKAADNPSIITLKGALSTFVTGALAWLASGFYPKPGSDSQNSQPK